MSSADQIFYAIFISGTYSFTFCFSLQITTFKWRKLTTSFIPLLSISALGLWRKVRRLKAVVLRPKASLGLGSGIGNLGGNGDGRRWSLVMTNGGGG